MTTCVVEMSILRKHHKMSTTLHLSSGPRSRRITMFDGDITRWCLSQHYEEIGLEDGIRRRRVWTADGSGWHRERTAWVASGTCERNTTGRCRRVTIEAEAASALWDTSRRRQPALGWSTGPTPSYTIHHLPTALWRRTTVDTIVQKRQTAEPTRAQQ